MAETIASEWFARARAAMLGANAQLRAETIDLEGTTLNAECRAIAIIGEELEWATAELDADSYLDTATGDALTRWGIDRYGVPRNGSTAAVVDLVANRVSGAAGSAEVPVGSTVTLNGVRFTTESQLRWTGTDVGDRSTRATSVLLGTSQNVPVGAACSFETTPSDPSITLVNPESAAGGNEAESDADYRARLRSAFTSYRRGTAAAIRDAALAVPQVREAAPYEVLDDEGHPVGVVVVVVADEDGGSNTAMEEAVSLAMDDARAFGVRVTVTGATVRSETISYVVTWATGQATQANALASRQAVVAFVNRLDPNGAADAAQAPAGSILDPGLVETAVRTLGDRVIRVLVISPAGPVAPDHGEVIRTDLGRVSVVAS